MAAVIAEVAISGAVTAEAATIDLSGGDEPLLTDEQPRGSEKWRNGSSSLSINSAISASPC